MTQRRIRRRVHRAGPTVSEAVALAAVRKKIEAEFPPSPTSRLTRAVPGLPARIRSARKARGLSWGGLAKLAGIARASTVRDLEVGRDVRLSDLQAVARALGLRLALVNAGTGSAGRTG